MIDTDGRHPSTVAIVRHFGYEHLPEHLQKVSRVFHDAVDDILQLVDDDPELTAGLRKLLEAKDCVVRAAVVSAGG